MSFRRVERGEQTRGLSVPCAECGKMLAYDKAFIGDEPFGFFHETCIPQEGQS